MNYVALTIHDSYLELASRGAETRVWATGTALTEPTVFERVELPHGRIALRTLTGQFLSCQPDGANNFGLYLADEIGAREAFEEILWPNQQVSLRSCELTYVTAQRGGGERVVVNRIAPGDWERFSYTPVPPGLVPPQVRRS